MRGFVKWTFEKVWDYFQSQLKYFIECLSIYLIKSNRKISENQWNHVHFCWKLCVSIFHVLIARFISPFVAIDLDYTDKTRWKNVHISIYERTKINNYQTSHLIIFPFLSFSSIPFVYQFIHAMDRISQSVVIDNGICRLTLTQSFPSH